MHRPLRRGRVGLTAVALALLAAPFAVPSTSRGARAADAPAPAPAVVAGTGFHPLDEGSWRAADGRLRRLYRPRFVPAEHLLADAQALGVAGVDMALDQKHSRLLLTAPDAAFERAQDALDWLDVPRPQVLVDLAIVETVSRCQVESGGHGLFDRGTEGPNTFFRGVRSDFEPDAWLRSELLGARPFEGTSLDLGRDSPSAPLAGSLELVLRRLSHRGEADFLANPSLVCTEGIPAEMRATLQLPATVFGRAGVVVNERTVVEKAGVELFITAVKVGADQVTLRVHPWLRQLASARDPDGPDSYPVLAIRELDTTVTLADGEEIVLGGLEAIDRTTSRNTIPGLGRLPGIGSVLSGRATERLQTDILFHLRVRILRPGRASVSILPPGELERLERRAREGAPRTGPRIGGSPCGARERPAEEPSIPGAAEGRGAPPAMAPAGAATPAGPSSPSSSAQRSAPTAPPANPAPPALPAPLPPPRWIRGG